MVKVKRKPKTSSKKSKPKVKRKPAKPAKKAPKRKPKRRKPVVVEVPKPRPQKHRCERCNLKFYEEDLVDVAEGQWCRSCNVRWYGVAISPEANPETVARNIRRKAKIDDVDELKEVLVPRKLVQEYSKTTWRVWRDVEAQKNGWRIPEHEDRPEVLAEMGLLGFITAETAQEAHDYARRKFPNDFDRIVELHNNGGKPRLVARPKFPGYLIFRAEYTFDVHSLIHRTGDVIGVLPVMPNPYNGFKYPRKEPKQRRKPQKWELEAVEEWSPTPLDSAEEVEKLLEEKQIVKNTPRKVEFKFPVGTRVQIINGPYKDVIATVDAVSQENPPKVVLAFEVLGRKVTTKAETWQVLKV